MVELMTSEYVSSVELRRKALETPQCHVCLHPFLLSFCSLPPAAIPLSSPLPPQAPAQHLWCCGLPLPTHCPETRDTT